MTARRCAACGAPYLERKRLFKNALDARKNFEGIEYRYPCICDGGNPFVDDGLGLWQEADVSLFEIKSTENTEKVQMNTIVGLSPFFHAALEPRDEESAAYIRNVVFTSSRARRRALLAARFYVQQTRKLIAMAARRGAASDVAEDVFIMLVAARDEHQVAHDAGERMRIYQEAL